MFGQDVGQVFGQDFGRVFGQGFGQDFGQVFGQDCGQVFGLTEQQYKPKQKGKRARSARLPFLFLILLLPKVVTKKKWLKKIMIKLHKGSLSIPEALIGALKKGLIEALQRA